MFTVANKCSILLLMTNQEFENLEEVQNAQTPEDFSDLLPVKKGKKKKTKSDKVATVLAIIIALFLLFQFGSGVIRLFTSPGLRDAHVSQNIFGNRHIVISHSRLTSYYFRATILSEGENISLGEEESRPHDGFMGKYVVRIMFLDISHDQAIALGEFQLENTPRQMDGVTVLVSAAGHGGLNIYIGSDTPMSIVSAGERIRFLRGSTRIRIE